MIAVNCEAFARVCRALEKERKAGQSIGTMGEKSVHWVVKHYLQPNTSRHEVPIGSYVADILDSRGIVEIQTRNFDQLRDKLEFYLPQYPVTVVHPIPARKRVVWLDEDSGEVQSDRLSPKRGSIHDVSRELYRIKGFLRHPNFCLHLLRIDLKELRYLNGWSRDRKRGSRRADRIPQELVEEVLLTQPQDYAVFLPDDLCEQFTSADFQKTAKITRRTAQETLNILHHMEVVERCGRSGRFHLYQVRSLH